MPTKLGIDPGHGMSNKVHGTYDPGACSGAVQEAAVALEYALAIKYFAKKRGIDVFLTRDDNYDDCPVSRRNDSAEAAGCTHFISLHCNSADADARGTETFYRDNEDKALAELVQAAALQSLRTHDRKVKSEGQSQHPHLAVLDFHGPACLVELGFLSNPEDREILTSRDSRIAFANAILDALT